jgi:hypothetical protein
MKESTHVSQQRAAHLQQVTWQNVNEPGAYVETGTGNLYRFPPEALIAGSSPVVRRENQDGGLLVQLSRDPFITTFEARMLLAGPTCQTPDGSRGCVDLGAAAERQGSVGDRRGGL